MLHGPNVIVDVAFLIKKKEDYLAIIYHVH